MTYSYFSLWPRILDILIHFVLQDKTLSCAFEAGDIVCWLVNPPIAKLDLFKSTDCHWICKTCAEHCYRNSATVRRLVQSPTLQSTIFCGYPNDLRGKGIRVSPACYDCFTPVSRAGTQKIFGQVCAAQVFKNRVFSGIDFLAWKWGLGKNFN